MSEKILDSKIQIPVRFRNFIARDDLLEQLSDPSVKVVVLNAGAGFGKTMLMTYYAEKTTDKCAWYHMSSLDNDIMTFIRYLSCSLNKVLEKYPFTYSNKLNKCGNELIESLANEFAIYLSQLSDYNISILLDDFQEINNEEIYNFLSILINSTNNNIRWLFATKGSFPKFLARFLLQGNAKVLNDRRLAFNRDEVMRILNDVKTLNDINVCIDFIMDYTEGWPAGVIAIALTLRNERKTIDRDEITALCKESKVYDYVMYEIFKKLPFDIQTFLIHTSVLNILSANLCNAVMNSTTAKGTLDYLVQENIFVIMLSGKGNVYRYHSIFKDYLRSQISKSVELDILKKAAIFCLNKADYEQAVEYAIACNDIELMQTAFELIGVDMIMHGETLTLNRWIEFLNNSKVKLSAKTKRVLSNYYYHKNDLVKAQEYIESACDDFELENNENDYVDAILQKVGYMEKRYELTKCLRDIMNALELVKRKYNANWYVLQAKKMELYLRIYNETEAVSTAEDILNGSMLYIRGGKEVIVNSIRESAMLIAQVGKQHIKEEIFDLNDYTSESKTVVDYCNWCKLQTLYRKGEREDSYRLTQSYIEMTETNDILTAYIKVIGCIHLLHLGRDEEATSLIIDIDRFFKDNQIEYPRLLEEDSQLMIARYQFCVDRRQNSRLLIQCFDEGAIYIDHRKQEIKWRTKKTFELFAYLFDRQGKATCKDCIISVLWPEMPYDKAAILFHTTLSYLRKNLTEYNLIGLLQNKSNGYLLDLEGVETDYGTLLEIYQEVQTGKADLLEKPSQLLELYKSPYFNNISSEWVINKRDHLERVYIQCSREIAERLLEQHQYSDSADILAKAIALDPYSEELLTLIMKTFAALGDIKSVKIYYEEAKKVFKDELNSELSAELEELFDEIVHKKVRMLEEA